MGARTGGDYLRSLATQDSDIWIGGERVKNPLEHPALAGPAQEIARLYDMQHEPGTADVLTAVCEETGEAVGRSFLHPSSYEELHARGEAFRAWARPTFGLLGRSPDFLNSTLAVFADAAEYFAVDEPTRGDNVIAYHRHVRDNDLFLTHALISPQIDRSKGAGQQEDPFTFLGAVSESSEGLVVRGAKMLATMGPLAEELIVYPIPGGVGQGEEAYSLAFAIPIATPGLRLICREPLHREGRSHFDHPLGSRFEEPDAVVVFDDVVIPWDRVFLYGDVSRANGLYEGTRLWQDVAHQTSVRAGVKLSLAAGIALRLADSVGVDSFLHVQHMLGEAIEAVETVRGVIDSAERNFEVRDNGHVMIANEAARTLRGIIPPLYARLVEVIQVIGAGGLLMMPTEADLAAPELSEAMDRFFRGRPGVSSRERIALFKLAWDLVGEGFGQRQLQYERYYGGDPVRMLAIHWRAYDKTDMFDLVDDALVDPNGR